MTEETKDLTRGGRARKGVGKPPWIEGKTKRIAERFYLVLLILN